MDLKVINKAIAATETVFDGFDERPVDCDFVLPDYFPDIAAVLKCIMKPMVQSKQLSGDRMIVDGIALIQVLYLDEARKCVHSCEFTKPFTSTFQVKASSNPFVTVAAKTTYVNCRATSPRRLDIHGAFSVKLKIVAETGSDVVSGISGDTIFTRKNVLTYSVPAASAEKMFSISEVLELGAGKPSAEALVRGDAVAVLHDCKILPNKAIIKGELMLSHLYVSNIDTGDMQKVRHEIPFSQIVDVDGLDEEWQCHVMLDVASSDIRITTNQNGEGKLLDVNVKLCASVQGYRTGMVEVVSDAYSTRYPMKLDYHRVSSEQMVAVRNSSSTIKETLDLPPDVANVVDIWVDPSLVSESCNNGRSNLAGRLMVCMLAKDTTGNVSYYERPVDFVLEFEDGCSCVTSDIGANYADYAINTAGKLDIRVDLNVTRKCMVSDSMNAVISVSVNENAAFPVETAALKIYFGNSGESVWEVAKACHTSMEAVMEENALASDVLAKDTMLLVPLC